MRLHSLLGFGLLLALGTACSASTSDSVSAESAQTGATTYGIVVQQAERMFSRHIGPDGKVTATTLDFEIQHGTHVLLAKQERPQATLTCEFAGATHDGSYSGSSLKLFDQTSSKDLGVLVPLLAQPGANDLAMSDEQRTEITGNVGRYVFVRERHDYFGCGAAHPSWGVNAFVWDLWSRDRAVLEAPAAALEIARRELANRGFPGAEVELAELIPIFDADARLRVNYRFEKAASHAEADGKGNDYSISAIVPSFDVADALPAQLAPHRDPPTVVQAYLRANPGQGATNPIKGWSISDDEQTMHGPMCVSQTLSSFQVKSGTCVQDSDNDGAHWYRCDADPDGAWGNVSGPNDPSCAEAVALCTSNTLGRKVTRGTCVEDIDDGKSYRCNGGGPRDWVKPPMNSCWESIRLCQSGTLGRKVAEGTCVQDSQGEHPWYRCGGRGLDDWSDLPKGPDSSCRSTFPFAR